MKTGRRLKMQLSTLADKGLNTVVEYGESCFTGPKTFMGYITGKTSQLGTIQVDYDLPDVFDFDLTKDQITNTDLHDTQSTIWFYGRYAILLEHSRKFPTMANA
jgi:threonyl-tRNA synthetase